MFDSEFLKHLLKLLPDLALILLFGLEMFLLPFHDFAEYSTSFPWCHSRETQILIPVYPNVIFNIPYTVHAVVCVGLWSGQTWGGCSSQVLQTDSIKANSLGWWENVPFSLQGSVLASTLTSYFQYYFHYCLCFAEVLLQKMFLHMSKGI